MNDTRLTKRGKCQQIQVFVRVRPTNPMERNNRSKIIVDIPNDKELLIHESANNKVSKKYNFDNVFGPMSKQLDVYNIVVSPLLEEVLAGYNCTVFAYGQTGTGKTFTMEGVNGDSALHWQSDSSAGMIPRSLSHLFDKLTLLEMKDYTIRVSFLELYNEDLFDLLSSNNDSSKIRLYEDSSKKGAVIIQGLEEVTIRNKSEVYNILQKGSEKRQTAATLMNNHSSRSHTVFSITVHMKEGVRDGEEVLKTGKLNLVDLAGSENIGRSGAIDKRAREAGSVNQSLLTLGRVITALIERAPHIPYRESKLTRLLQESLGGRTKTSIIATISPAAINLEETLSTLDYAYRAQNITNRPEINQKLSKKEFLKQYTEEIEKLRRDLEATRERNGVYLADENYQKMQTLISQQKEAIEEKINYIKACEKNMQHMEQIYNELEIQTISQMRELNEVKAKLHNVSDALKSTDKRLKVTVEECDKQKLLVEKYVSTEQRLLHQAENLLSVADTAASDSYMLHDKIVRKTEIEQMFETLSVQFKNKISECVKSIEKDVSAYTRRSKRFFTSVKNDIGTHIANKHRDVDTAVEKISIDLIIQHFTDINKLKKCVDDACTNNQNWTKNKILMEPVSNIESVHDIQKQISMKLACDIRNVMINKIALRMRNNVSEKFKQTSMAIEDMIDNACNEQLKTLNNINKNVKIIMNDIEQLHKKQQFTEKQRLFAKVIEDAASEYRVLYKNQQEHYSIVDNKYNYVSKTCNDAIDYSMDNCTKIITRRNNLKDHTQSNLEKIKDSIILETKENEKLMNNIVEERNALITDLNSNIDKSCSVLKDYQILTGRTVIEAQERMDTDNNRTLSLINDVHVIITNMSKDYIEIMKRQQLQTSDTSKEITSKLENGIKESTTWNETIEKQLQTTQKEINKFFEKDIKRDFPTGTTPVRKEFSYPRQFIATSPHERILQKYRQTRKIIETMEDDSLKEENKENVDDILT